MIQFLSGAIMMGMTVCCLFLFRGWRQTGDRLLLYFGIAFGLLALERVALATLHAKSESHPEVYVLRLVAFALIAFAVIRKNLERGTPE